ncbi:MAG: PspC domain-containing protein [Candidatus Kapabacteria bacterium]|nr:PspC domain-containing protein [Candidatus Kapabacteria bacterium]
MKRLYRIEKNKVFGGVCGGLAEYFEVDPVLVRVLFVVLFFGWGISLLAYIILWIVTPKKSDIIIEKANNTDENQESINYVDERFKEINHREIKNHRLFGGFILIAIGTLWLFSNIFEFFDLSIFFPILIILIGIFILLNSKYSGISTKTHNNLENI